MNNTARGVIYVSVWVVIWGTASSLVDWLLLNADLYQSGSFGQAATFIGYGAAASVLGVRLSNRFLFKTNEAGDGIDGDQSSS